MAYASSVDHPQSTVHTTKQHIFSSDLGKLAKPSYQMVLERALGIRIRAVQCYDCPTAQCGSGHDTELG